MQLGELFFSLGFKSTGQAEIKGFESGISGAQEVSAKMQATLEELVFIIENIAYKMGALTAKQLENYRISKESMSLDKDFAKIKEKKNTHDSKQLGILGVMNQKMVQYWGATNAARLQMIGLATGVTYFVKKLSEAAVFLDRTSSLTGISADTMQRLGAMAGETGTKMDTLAGAVSMFQQESINIKLGRGGNIGVWQFLGIDPHQDPLVIMEKLSKKLKTMPAALGTTMAKDLGLSEDMIYFLKNASEIKAPKNETILTDKEIKRLKDFNFYFNRVFDQSRRVLEKMGAAVTPVVNLVLVGIDKVTAMFARWLAKIEKYQESIKGFLPYIAAGLVAIAAAVAPALFALVLLLVALEDIDGYLNGKDSVTGRLIAYFKDLQEVVQDTAAIIAAMVSLVVGGKAGDFLGDAIMKAGTRGFVDPTQTEEYKQQRLNKDLARYNVYNNVTDHVTIQVDGAKSPRDTVNQIEENWKRIVSNTYFATQQGGI